jgi:hypothetical protein
MITEQRRKKMAERITYGLSRRAFLQGIGMASVGLTLVACTPVAPGSGEGGATGGAEANELKVLVCCYAPPDLEVRNKEGAGLLLRPTGSGSAQQGQQRF